MVSTKLLLTVCGLDIISPCQTHRAGAVENRFIRNQPGRSWVTVFIVLKNVNMPHAESDAWRRVLPAERSRISLLKNCESRRARSFFAAVRVKQNGGMFCLAGQITLIGRVVLRLNIAR